MKFEPNHIDDIFRQRLHDAEVAPPAFVWPNVERELQKRKRRRFFFWLFAFTVAGTGLWAMSVWRKTSKPEVATTQQIFSENKNEAITANELPKQTEHQKTTQPTTGLEKTGNKQKAKGANSRLGNPDVPTLSTGENWNRNNSPVLPAVVLADENEQIAQAEILVEDFLLLENAEFESLAFIRQDLSLPKKSKVFIRKKKDPKYCYDFAQNPNVWMLDVYAGPSFSKQGIEAKNADFGNYAQMRRSTEQPDWSFNAGLRGSLLLGRHFLVRSSAHYEQRTEIFEHFDPSYVKYIVEIINKPGEPPIIDTVGVDYGENYVKTFNRFGMLDIPLEVGGEMRSGRFGLSLNAGVSLNVLFWKRGKILSPDGQPATFTPGADEPYVIEAYRPRTGLSASASAQLFFHIKPRFRVFAEPYYRRVLKSVTPDAYPIEQRFSNWGIKIGATKILN